MAVQFDSFETGKVGGGNTVFVKIPPEGEVDGVVVTGICPFPSNFEKNKDRKVCGFYQIDKEGKGTVRILDLKKTIFDPLQAFAKKKVNWNSFLVTISRKGAGMNDTKYTISGMSREPLADYDKLAAEAVALIEKTAQEMQNKGA